MKKQNKKCCIYSTTNVALTHKWQNISTVKVKINRLLIFSKKISKKIEATWGAQYGKRVPELCSLANFTSSGPKQRGNECSNSKRYVWEDNQHLQKNRILITKASRSNNSIAQRGKHWDGLELVAYLCLEEYPELFGKIYLFQHS